MPLSPEELAALAATTPEQEFATDSVVVANGAIITARLTDGVLVELTTVVPTVK